jgi:hypothetical protein
VFRDGGQAIRSRAAAIAGEALAAVENLDCVRGDSRLGFLANQLVQHAVVVLASAGAVANSLIVLAKSETSTL